MKNTWATKFLRQMKHKPDAAPLTGIITVLLIIVAFFILFLKSR